MIDESALLQAARTLDKDGLTTIFETYAPAIYRYTLRLCHDPIDSDNVVGDVFSRLLEQCSAGKGPVANLKSYLFQTAYHLIVDRARNRQRMVDLEAITEAFIPGDSSTQIQVEERAMMDALIVALNIVLSEDQRHVIVLRFLEGFSLKETGVIIGKNVNSVKVIQNRGIARLQKCLPLDVDNNKPDIRLRYDVC